MKNVNQLVLEVQAEGKDGLAFVELFEVMMSEVIEPKAKSYSRQLKGDVSEAISEGTALLIELVDVWNGTGKFSTFFTASFNNRIRNLVKYMNRDKRKHNTSYDLSLSETCNNGGENSPIIEVIDAEELHTTFDITEDNDTETLLDLLEEYEVKKPKTAGLIRIMISFPNNARLSEKTQAYANYFGQEEYNTVIQKRVSRARESFQKFLLKNNYTFSI
ncbi:hypothetical protein [Priestia megaterium]|uniref:hypothetical protein n=1 Tax=Priestia megaterium TaxID=1404 RepID=UPI0023DB504E|nr:hypothetical protein [Priestia megaterium]MDF2010249.1 hypothetical protein [Priestia megaterium]